LKKNYFEQKIAKTEFPGLIKIAYLMKEEEIDLSSDRVISLISVKSVTINKLFFCKSSTEQNSTAHSSWSLPLLFHNPSTKLCLCCTVTI